MAETAVSMAGQHVLSKILEAVKMLRGLQKEVEEITEELESFQDFINDADKVAEAEQDGGKRDLIKKRVMRLREAAFRMEDVIDLYDICEEKQPGDPGCAALPCEAVDYVKTLVFRLQIAYGIQGVKSLVQELKVKYSLQSKLPLEPRPSSSRGNQNVPWHNLRMVPLTNEGEVVGLEGPIQILKNWLMKGREERTVISVVGIPGVGKTTLAKQVFDNVHNDFDCHALITVSQSYTPEGLLREMLSQFCKEKEDLPQNVSEMGQRKDLPQNVSELDRRSLIEEVQKHLHNKRYVVLFDDVWNENFWDDIESAVIDDKNKSRILITTRYEKVAVFCKSFIKVYKLEEPLSEDESFRLFCRKAFKYDSDGSRQEELKDISLQIVRKCKCLPLAIVAIGGLLSQKDKSAPEWGLFSKNLSLELERNSELTKILSLSYDDLPYNLRSCLLYFGMYPEDYEVKSSRLIRQWIAEGFVKHETEKNLEEVAQEYLIELISRSLVQVSSFTKDGKVKGCRVHDSIHEMIRGKMKDKGFCQYIDEHNQMVPSGVVRRLTIANASNDLIGSIERSHIRSILIFTQEQLSEHFISGILAKYMPLKILDFENAPFDHVPENLGNLIHLKYLSFRKTWIKSLPESIGKLQNLETLDIRQTGVFEMPKEICKLRKLQHLLAKFIYSTQLKDSLGGMTSLQTISVLKIDDDVVVIRELGKLKQLRNMGITNFRGEQSSTLCSSIDEMQLLEKLYIETTHSNEVIDLHYMSTPSALRKLCLNGKLKMLPYWIPRLQNLVRLSLNYSQLTHDPLESIKDLPNLLFLSIVDAYEGETLHFQIGGFQKLKELELKYLSKLNSIIFDRGSLHSLKKLQLRTLKQLKTVPSGIPHLKKLEFLDIFYMSTEFEWSIAPNGGQEHWMIQHVPHINITSVPPVVKQQKIRGSQGTRC